MGAEGRNPSAARCSGKIKPDTQRAETGHAMLAQLCSLSTPPVLTTPSAPRRVSLQRKAYEQGAAGVPNFVVIYMFFLQGDA